jgi:hypothetical protein
MALNYDDEITKFCKLKTISFFCKSDEVEFNTIISSKMLPVKLEVKEAFLDWNFEFFKTQMLEYFEGLIATSNFTLKLATACLETDAVERNMKT